MRGTPARPKGQTSSAHSVMTRSTEAGSIVSTDFENCEEMSIPASRSASIACGLTRDGCEPALCTRTRGPNLERARPSAIWLGAELATQRNRIDDVAPGTSKEESLPV